MRAGTNGHAIMGEHETVSILVCQDSLSVSQPEFNDKFFSLPPMVPPKSDVWQKLVDVANPQSKGLSCTPNSWADAVNFQPDSSFPSQDRYVIEQLNIDGRVWSLTGVLDGHLGDATVQHAAHHLPIIIRNFLKETINKHAGHPIPPPLIADMLCRAVTSFDEAIAHDVLDLFPGGLASLSDLTDEEIQATINDLSAGGENYNKARLCLYGTTAIIALVDPEYKNLWVVNLGDCQGVMVSESPEQSWSVEVLTTLHNGDNPTEVERVRREHPGEPDCVQNGRVLGAIAPFRCIGDTPFKQPSEFTRRILYNLSPGSHDVSPWEEVLRRNHTPPYISAIPEVTHCTLQEGRFSNPCRKFLILSSDGFKDICPRLRHTIDKWAAESVQGQEERTDSIAANLALHLLWFALGGDDLSVSQVLTTDADGPVFDDTAIVVHSL